MRTADGKDLHGTNNTTTVVTCTRWKELQASVKYHAELAGCIKATTVFRMLNDPGAKVGPHEFSICDTNTSEKPIEQEVADAIRIVRQTDPNGVTPLTGHLEVIHQRVQQMESQLRSQGQKAVVVIATDGLPSDENGDNNGPTSAAFVEAVKRLQRLPVWLVIRLCTDMYAERNFYKGLDTNPEYPIECIDDYLTEAKEIKRVNPWLNYGLPLHRCREMGYQHSLIDSLDERSFTRDEISEFLYLLFGAEAMEKAPDIHTDWKGFDEALQQIVSNESKIWNPSTHQTEPWINMKQLSRMYGEHKGFLGFGRKK
jgi:hypothetical protein